MTITDQSILFSSIQHHPLLTIFQSIHPLEYPWLLSCLVTVRQEVSNHSSNHSSNHFNRQWQFLLTLVDRGQTSFLEDQADLLSLFDQPKPLDELTEQMYHLQTMHDDLFSLQALRDHLSLFLVFFAYTFEDQISLIKVIEKIALVFEFDLEKLYEWQREFHYLLSQQALNLIFEN